MLKTNLDKIINDLHSITTDDNRVVVGNTIAALNELQRDLVNMTDSYLAVAERLRAKSIETL